MSLPPLHPEAETLAFLATTRHDGGEWVEVAHRLDQEGHDPRAILGGILLAASPEGTSPHGAVRAVTETILGLGLGWLIRTGTLSAGIPDILGRLGAHPWSLYFAASAHTWRHHPTGASKLRDEWLNPLGESLEIPPGLRMATTQGGLTYSAQARVHALPENLILFGDLLAPKARKIDLPRHLRILGDLYTPESALTTIPEGTWVLGAGNFANCADLTAIEPRVRFGGRLILTGVRTHQLRVSGDLQAEGVVL